MKPNFYTYLALRTLRAMCLIAAVSLSFPVLVAVLLLLEVVVIPVADWVEKVRADWKERQ